MAHPNEALVRKGYEAFAKADMATLGDLFAGDVIWNTPGKSPLSGTRKGQQEVFEQFGQIAQLTGGNFSLDIHDVLANDEHAIALVTAKGSREGKSIDDHQVHVFHIQDGKVTEFWGHPTDLYAVDEFWS
ncbi:MAG: nuclear transport factor 2 family protein [Actinomycetota bacterium]